MITGKQFILIESDPDFGPRFLVQSRGDKVILLANDGSGEWTEYVMDELTAHELGLCLTNETGG